jgi:uncharacterized protein involved in exopolysaccharide biosynthesis
MSESGIVFGGLRRGWWIVLLAALVGVASAWLWTRRETPRYLASATLVATLSSSVEDTGDLLDGIETLERRTLVATFAEIPGRVETKEEAAREMGIEPRELRAYWVGGVVVPHTNLLRIDVRGPDPERAAELANRAAEISRDEARSFYRVFTLRHLERAEPPRRPETPDPGRNLIVGGVLGLFFGLALALAAEALRGSRRAA